MKRSLLVLFVMSFLWMSLAAQEQPESTINLDPASLLPLRQNDAGFSIFHPENFQMGHSVSFFAGGSSNGDGFYQSKYTNHLMFSFTPELDLQVDLNFVNYGTADIGDGFEVEGNDDNQSRILPDFQLEYRPFENTVFRVEYNTSGGPYRTWDPWRD